MSTESQSTEIVEWLGTDQDDFRRAFGTFYNQYADGWFISGCNRVGFAPISQETYPGHQMELWDTHPIMSDHNKRQGTYVHHTLSESHAIDETLTEQVAHFCAGGNIETLHENVYVRSDYENMPVLVRKDDYQLLLAPMK